MASFSFGAGNAGKILRIPLYIAGRIVTMIVPRTADRWVFGSAVGIADGALALWERAAADHQPALWLTGSDDEAAEAARRGITHLPRSSWRGFWATTRARFVVITHGFGDANRYGASGAYVIQLWHGIPLKRLGLDTPATTDGGVLGSTAFVSRMLEIFYRRTQRHIRLLPAASHLVRGRLESAFGLGDGAVVVTGEPRVDSLSAPDPAARRVQARTVMAARTGHLDEATRVVLYAPTWRDGEPDPAIPTDEEWAALERTLVVADAVLLVRAHPLGVGEYPAPSRHIRLCGSDLVSDITPMLVGVDVLITDYSSLVYDASLVPVPAVFFAPDLDAYARHRGFYGTYADVAGTDYATTWSEVTAQVLATLEQPEEYERRRARAAELSAHVHDFSDGANTDRVYRAALDAIKGVPE